MNNRKYNQLLKDTSIFALGNLGSKLILFFMVPLYTHSLTTEEYGIADLISTLSELIVPFVSLVVFDAVQRFALSKDETKEDVLLCGLLTCFVGSVVWAVSTPLLSLYHPISEWKWYLYWYVTLIMFGNVEKNYLKADNKNRLFAVLSILQTALLALLNVLLLTRKGMGVQGYLLSMCIANLVPVVGSFAFGGLARAVLRARLDVNLLARMLAYSSPLILNNISWWAIHSFDKMLLEAVIGASALGVYTVATKMPSLVNVLTAIFSQAWGLSAVREYESDNDASFYSNVLELLAIAVFGATISLVAIMKSFMTLYVGPSFHDSWKYVPMLLVSAAFYSIGSYYGSMYSALKKSMNNMITTMISACICVLSTLLLVPSSGIWGAVIGTFLAYLSLMLTRMIDVHRYIEIRYGGWRFFATASIAVLQSIIVPLSPDKGIIISGAALILFAGINLKTIITLARSR